MLALPPKRPVGRQTGLGDALTSYASKTHSGTEANRARAASSSLDRCRAAAAAGGRMTTSSSRVLPHALYKYTAVPLGHRRLRHGSEHTTAAALAESSSTTIRALALPSESRLCAED